MESENYKKCLEGVKIVHMLLTPQSLEYVATFLVSSLLISHGIRKDTISIIKLSKLWLCAPGSKLRQLRPDLDSSVGWIKAVLRNHKKEVLGSVKLQELPPFDKYGFKKISILCFSQAKKLIKDRSIWQFMLSNYKDDKVLIVYNEGSNIVKVNEIFMLGVSCKYAPVLINISLDRIEEDKKLIF